MNTNAVFRNADLVVKCFMCDSTYEVKHATLTMTVVADPDTFEFWCFEVTFDHSDGTTIYIDDLLCVKKHCSVFGRLPNGDMFAFPFLAKSHKGLLWLSSADSKGSHFAMRQPKSIIHEGGK